MYQAPEIEKGIELHIERRGDLLFTFPPEGKEKDLLLLKVARTQRSRSRVPADNSVGYYIDEKGGK